MGLMDQVTARLCKEIMGSVFGYVQSDEISLHLVDFDPDKDKLGREAWFDGNLQKMVSVSASLATAFFNELALDQMPEHLKQRGFAKFDSRVFTINDPIEVYNYFVWRQNDATRNSILGAARSYFSDKECFGKSCKELLDMLLQKGCNWNDYPCRFKRGGFIWYNEDVTMGKALNKKTGEEITYQKPIGWDVLKEVPIFTRGDGRKWLWGLIPKMPVFDFDETTTESVS